MSELKPCPNPICLGHAIELVHSFTVRGDYNVVRCQNCRALGPAGKTSNEAARLWNLLPRTGDLAEAWEAGVRYALHDGPRHWTGALDQASIVNPYRKPATVSLPSAAQTALAKRLAERARELVALDGAATVYSALGIARNEVEVEQRAELTHAVAQAYALIETSGI